MQWLSPQRNWLGGQTAERQEDRWVQRRTGSRHSEPQSPHFKAISGVEGKSLLQAKCLDKYLRPKKCTCLHEVCLNMWHFTERFSYNCPGGGAPPIQWDRPPQYSNTVYSKWRCSQLILLIILSKCHQIPSSAVSVSTWLFIYFQLSSSVHSRHIELSARLSSPSHTAYCYRRSYKHALLLICSRAWNLLTVSDWTW